MTVYLEYEGKPVPIRKCSWLLVAPCGCVAGIHVAESHGDMPPIVSVEQAHAAFTANSELRRREADAGWTARVCGDRATAIASMTDPEKCPHTPRWGEEPIPEREDWVWAAAKRSRRSHLIPAREDGEYWRTCSGLCGAEHWGWQTERWAVQEMPTCRRCEALALEPEQAVAS